MLSLSNKRIGNRLTKVLSPVVVRDMIINYQIYEVYHQSISTVPVPLYIHENK